MGVSVFSNGPTLTLFTNSAGGVPTGQWTGTRSQLIEGVMNLQTKAFQSNSVNVDGVITAFEADLILTLPGQLGRLGMYEQVLNEAWNAQRSWLRDRIYYDDNVRELTKSELVAFIDQVTQDAPTTEDAPAEDAGPEPRGILDWLLWRLERWLR